MQPADCHTLMPLHPYQSGTPDAPHCHHQLPSVPLYNEQYPHVYVPLLHIFRV